MHWRAELRALIDAIPEAELLDGYAEVSRAQAAIMQRLSPNGQLSRRRDKLNYLKAEEVAEMLGVDVSWVYRHRDDLGALDLSDRCVRYPEACVRAFLERRRGVDCPR